MKRFFYFISFLLFVFLVLVGAPAEKTGQTHSGQQIWLNKKVLSRRKALLQAKC